MQDLLYRIVTTSDETKKDSFVTTFEKDVLPRTFFLRLVPKESLVL